MAGCAAGRARSIPVSLRTEFDDPGEVTLVYAGEDAGADE